MCMENWERELAIRASDGRSASTSEKVDTRRRTNRAVLFLVKLQILPCKIETKGIIITKKKVSPLREIFIKLDNWRKNFY